MSSAIGDIVDNPAIDDEGGRGNPAARGQLGALAKALQWGAYGVGSAINGAQGLGKYVSDTFTADHNSIPISRRLLVAAAPTPDDKINTLRQWYKNVTMDNGELSFYDPVLKKQMTVNDAGLSMGDIANSLPSWAEGLGTAGGASLGAAGGSLAGSTAGSAIPGVGTAIGGVSGGIAGGGAGGAAGGIYGKEMGEGLASKLGQLLGGGGKSFDTRTPQQQSSDNWNTGKWDALAGAIGPAAQGVKVYAASKFLTPESGILSDAAKAAGYVPNLNQIGSPTGAAVESKLVKEGAGDFAKTAQANEGVLNDKVSNFLGENADASKNDLANSLRAGNQQNVGGLKSAASDLYENYPFSNTAVPDATSSKTIAQQILDLKGAGKDINPTYDFDPTINASLSRLASGKMTENELNQLDTNIGFYLKKGQAYPQAGDMLKNLRDNIRSDLVEGAPGTAPQEQQARTLWKQAKDTQSGLTNLFGNAEGVTQGVADTGGMSEGQNLNKGLGVFSNGPMGSDTKAAAMSGLLSDQDKQTLLASILKQPPTKTMNGVDAANNQFNMQRVAQYLANPDQASQLSDLVSSSKGVLPYSQLPPNTSPLLQSGWDTLKNRSQKWGVNSAINSAKNGNVPGNYTFNPSVSESPLTVGAARAYRPILNANSGVDPNRVSDKVMQAELPDSMKTNSITNPMSLDMVLAKIPNMTPKGSSNLDSLLSTIGKPPVSGPSVTDYQGKPLDRNVYQGANDPVSNKPVSDLGYQALDNFQKPATIDDLNSFIAQQKSPPTPTATTEDLNNFIASTKSNNAPAQQGQMGVKDAIAGLEAIKKNRPPPIANKDITAVGAAFLKTLSGNGLEGTSKYPNAGYHTLVGGSQIDDLSNHPNVVGVVTPQGKSTAFGRYQFINPTWQDQQSKYGYQDMSPQNQDSAAWNLAQNTHNRATGGDLATELASGNPDRIASAVGTLAPVWSSLPGGVQQGSGSNNFVQNFQQNLNDEPATRGDLNAYISQINSQPQNDSAGY